MVAAREIEELILPHKGAERVDSGCAKKVRPGWRDVEGLDFRALVLGAKRIASYRIGSAAIQAVVGVGRLKPGTRELAIDRNRINIAQLEIDSIENIFFVAF